MSVPSSSAWRRILLPAPLLLALLLTPAPAPLSAHPGSRSGIRAVGALRPQNSMESKMRQRLSKVPRRRGQDQQKASSCTALKDNGAFITGGVTAGTPPQALQLIPDTGSDVVVIASCNCIKSGSCTAEETPKCFQGTGNSSTFAMDSEPPVVTLSYGSGNIEAVVASDVVRVGQAQATMDHGMFLMVDNTLGELGPPFEGLIGLGPNPPQQTSLFDRTLSYKSLPWGGSSSKPKQEDGEIAMPRFISSAGVNTFSMCLDSHGGGALELGVASGANPLGSIGVEHWGLDLQGVSVGKVSAPVIFCSPDSKASGMTSACGAIPDTGTTLLVAGSSDQLWTLFGALCDAWPRCSKSLEKGGDDTKKIKAFEGLIDKCADWLGSGGGVDELPTLYFHFGGTGGSKDSVGISPRSYLLSGKSPDGKVNCQLAFETADYVTKSNGPVWVMGLPLFAEKKVIYDMAANTISFSDETCSSCDDKDFVARSGRNGHKRRGTRPLTRGRTRHPSFNVTQAF